MTERTWVRFTATFQAKPGRRMRAYAQSLHSYTVLRRELRDRRPCIVFDDGYTISVADAKSFQWWIEL